MALPDDNDALPEGDQEDRGSDLERLVRWMEARRFLWPTNVVLFVLCFAGTNGLAHDKPGPALAFGIIAILVLLAGRDRSETFFGASALALLIVVHITLFGVDAVALIAAFVVFVAARAWVSRHLFGPVSVYLVLDTLATWTGAAEQADVTMAEVGRQVFESPYFYTVLSAIPLMYAYLKIDDWGRRRFSSPFLKYDLGYAVPAISLLIFAPIGIIYDSLWVQALMAPALGLLFMGEVVSQKKDLSWKRIGARILFLILFTATLITSSAVRHGGLEAATRVLEEQNDRAR